MARLPLLALGILSLASLPELAWSSVGRFLDDIEAFIDGCPSGWTKHHKDLNAGAGGSYIYFCYKASVSSTPRTVVTDIRFTEGSCPSGYWRDGTDLNTGAGGAYIYLCVLYGSSTSGVTDFITSGSLVEAGWRPTLFDLNKGAGGEYIYLHFQTCGDGIRNAYEYCDGGAGCSSCRCDSGYYGGSGQHCSSCPGGKYSNPGSSSSAYACTLCPAGTSTNGASTQSSCSTCPGGTYSPGVGDASCGTCPAGRYSGSGASSCSSCSPGQYSSSGWSSCGTCPGGKYSGSLAGSCSSCSPGHYSGSGASGCTQCPYGTYQPGWDGTGCPACPAGTYGPSMARSSCPLCPGGQYSWQGDSSCRTCTAGRYSSQGWGHCEVCPGGRYSAASAPSCTNCNPGTWQPNSEQTGCLNCQAGRYCPSSGHSSEGSICPEGTYGASGGLSSTICSGYCSPGYRCPAGTITPQPCAQGYWCRHGIQVDSCYTPAFCQPNTFWESTHLHMLALSGTVNLAGSGGAGQLRADLTGDIMGARVTDVTSAALASSMPEANQAVASEQAAFILPPLTAATASALDEAALAHVRGAVQRGMNVVAFGDAAGHMLDLLNAFFYWSLLSGTTAASGSTASRRSAYTEAAGFTGTPSTHAAGSGSVHTVKTSSLPNNVHRVYGTGGHDTDGSVEGDEWVFVAPVGCGTVTYIGADWATRGWSTWEPTLDRALKQARISVWCSNAGSAFIVTDEARGSVSVSALGNVGRGGARRVHADLIARGYVLTHVPAPWGGALDSAGAGTVPVTSLLVFPPLVTHEADFETHLSRAFVDDMQTRVLSGQSVLVVGGPGDADETLLRHVFQLPLVALADSAEDAAAAGAAAPEADLGLAAAVGTAFADAALKLSSPGRTWPPALSAAASCVRLLYSDPDARAPADQPLLSTALLPWVMMQELGCGRVYFVAFDWSASGPWVRTAWTDILIDDIVVPGIAHAGAANSCTAPEKVCRLDVSNNEGGVWRMFDVENDPTVMQPLSQHAVLLCELPPAC